MVASSDGFIYQRRDLFPKDIKQLDPHPPAFWHVILDHGGLAEWIGVVLAQVFVPRPGVAHAHWDHGESVDRRARRKGHAVVEKPETVHCIAPTLLHPGQSAIAGKKCALVATKPARRVIDEACPL